MFARKIAFQDNLLQHKCFVFNIGTVPESAYGFSLHGEVVPHTGPLVPHTGLLVPHTGSFAPHTGLSAPHTGRFVLFL